jgi:AbrB family looped-hinge helix DNA binding protein
MTTTITGKNQVTLPAELVRALDWKVGTQLEWTKTPEGTLIARRKPTRGELARELQDMMKKYIKPGESVVEGLLRDRAEDDALDREDEERGL